MLGMWCYDQQTLYKLFQLCLGHILSLSHDTVCKLNRQWEMLPSFNPLLNKVPLYEQNIFGADLRVTM